MNDKNDQKEDPIQQDECLYRRVKNKGKLQGYRCMGNNRVKILPDAFYDNKRQPSVYRAKLLNCKAEKAIPENRDIEGIVSILAKDIRSIKGVYEIIGDDKIEYDIKVRPEYDKNEGDKDRANAHAIIFTDPAFKRKKYKNKKTSPSQLLKIALARIVNKKNKVWDLPPKIKNCCNSQKSE